MVVAMVTKGDGVMDEAVEKLARRLLETDWETEHGDKVRLSQIDANWLALHISEYVDAAILKRAGETA
jgi:hypothetical protein